MNEGVRRGWWDANGAEWIESVAVLSALDDPSFSGVPLAETLSGIVRALEDPSLISRLRAWETQSDGFKTNSIRLGAVLRNAATHIETHQVTDARQVTSRLSVMLTLIDEIVFELLQE